jgi:hypothetical protein
MLSSLSQPESNTRTSAEIYASAVPDEPDPEPKSEKTGNAETEIGGTEILAERNGVDDIEPTPKKSLAFKLAFIGLAASLFVFQLDATALGIALPVSNNKLSLSPSNSITSLTPRRLTSTIDHSW